MRSLREECEAQGKIPSSYLDTNSRSLLKYVITLEEHFSNAFYRGATLLSPDY